MSSTTTASRSTSLPVLYEPEFTDPLSGQPVSDVLVFSTGGPGISAVTDLTGSVSVLSALSFTAESLSAPPTSETFLLFLRLRTIPPPRRRPPSAR